MNDFSTQGKIVFSGTFPDFSDYTYNTADIEDTRQSDSTLKPAVWPFGQKDEGSSSKIKPKSTTFIFILTSFYLKKYHHHQTF